MSDQPVHTKRSQQARKPPVPRRVQTQQARTTGVPHHAPESDHDQHQVDPVPHLTDVPVQEDLYEDPDLPALPESISVPSGEELLLVVEAVIPDADDGSVGSNAPQGATQPSPDTDDDALLVDVAAQTEDEQVPGDALSIVSDIDGLRDQMQILKEDRKVEIERIRSLEEELGRMRVDVTLLATAFQRLEQTVKRAIVEPSKGIIKSSETEELAPVVLDPTSQLREIRKTLIGEGVSSDLGLSGMPKAPLPRRRGP